MLPAFSKYLFKKPKMGNFYKSAVTHPVLIAYLTGTFISFIFFGFEIRAQQSANSGSNTNSASSETPVPKFPTTPIPVSFIITEKEKTEKRLQEIEKFIADQSSIPEVQNNLSELIKDFDAREQKTTELLSARPSLETLDKQEIEWKAVAQTLSLRKSSLQAQAADISNQITELQNILSTWEQTQREFEEDISRTENEDTSDRKKSTTKELLTGNENAGNTASASAIDLPENIRDSITEIIGRVKETQTKAGSYLSELLKVQEKISETEKRIDNLLAKIADMQKGVISNLIVKDAAPIWDISNLQKNLGQEVQKSFAEKLSTLRDYFARHRGLFLFHLLIILALILAFHRARRKTRQLVEEEPKLRQGLIIFEYPLASALILGLFFGPLLYPQAPELLGVIISPVLIIAIFFLIRQLIEKEYLPILIAIVILYLINDLRLLTASVPFLSRVLFLTEMLGGIIFLLWLIRSKNRTAVSDGPDPHHDGITKKIGIFVVLPFTFAFMSNALGYVSLAGIIGRAIVTGAVLALVFYALMRVFDSLLNFVFRISPFSRLMMVKSHRRLIQKKLFKFTKWMVIFSWFLILLNLIYVLKPFFALLEKMLTSELKIGTISLTLGGIVLLILTIWFSFLLSRFIRFALEEDVYTRVRLADGLPYAVSTILHYLILFFGFLLAIAAMGIDLTQFTVLLGAFGVGLGFGLQNIIENFTSGLILLFERPVKVGDSIQMDQNLGQLRHIGLRASIVRTFDGAEIIVPNGQLITREVTNWTLSDPRRRIDIDIGVEYGADPEQVIKLLEEVGNTHPEADDELAPRALFLGFGDSALNFQLRVWTANDKWVVIRSELAIGIYKTLNKAGIEIPFPQRDLHLRSVSRELLGKIKLDSK